MTSLCSFKKKNLRDRLRKTASVSLATDDVSASVSFEMEGMSDVANTKKDIMCGKEGQNVGRRLRGVVRVVDKPVGLVERVQEAMVKAIDPGKACSMSRLAFSHMHADSPHHFVFLLRHRLISL